MAGERQAIRAASKKEQIAGAARGLFLSQGYAGTTMDGVSAAARVSKQTLYSYFPSKVDLLAEVLGEELASLGIVAVRKPRISSLGEFREELLAIAHSLTSRWTHDDGQQLLRLVLGEVARLPELRDAIGAVFPGTLLHQVQELIQEAADAGLIHTPRPDLSARIFLGPVMSFVTLDGLFRTDGALQPDSDDLSYVVDAFLATVQVKRGP